MAVYSHEDRLSMHRQKADEAYEIGQRGQYTPVGAYLAGDEIIKIALQHNVNMIHPGYGFLSENAEFARNVEKAGLIVSLPPLPEPCLPYDGIPAFVESNRPLGRAMAGPWRGARCVCSACCSMTVLSTPARRRSSPKPTRPLPFFFPTPSCFCGLVSRGKKRLG